jgi:GTPase SAR1 family protein
MEIEQVENNNLRIVPTRQTIDKKLGVPEPFPDKNSCLVVSGGQGSGKTTFMNSILTNRSAEGRVYYKKFEKIFYMTPSEVMSSENSHPFKDHEPSRLYHELTVENLDNVIDQALEEKEEGGNSCLIIDDFSEELKNNNLIKHLKKLIHKHRHYRLNIIISVLTLKSLPKSLRSLIDIYILFKPKSLIEVDTMSEEIFGLSKRNLLQLFDYIFDAPHIFLFYNQRSNKFYKNFNLLRIKK